MKSLQLIIYLFVLLLYHTICFSQNSSCSATFSALKDGGLFEYSETEISENTYKSIINYFKYHRFEHYEEARSAGLSVGIPLGDIMVGLGLEANESGYRTFIENIDNYFSSYSSNAVNIKAKYKKVNQDLVSLLDNCFKSERGVIAFPVFTQDPNQIIIRFHFSGDYLDAPKKAILAVSGQTDNIRVIYQTPKNIVVSNASSEDVIVQKTDNKVGTITFRSKNDTRAPYGLSFSFPTLPVTPPKPSIKIFSQNVIPTEYTYTPPKIGSGDADFDGECDIISNASLTLSPDSTQLILNVYMLASEPHSDWTKAGGTGTKVIFQTDNPHRKIIKVNGPTSENMSLQERNDYHDEMTFVPYTLFANVDLEHPQNEILKSFIPHILEIFKNTFTNNGLIEKWIVLGDTKGDEAGTKTHIKAITKPISLTIRDDNP